MRVSVRRGVASKLLRFHTAVSKLTGNNEDVHEKYYNTAVYASFTLEN